mmetsp:Transcript_159832/g.298013  ORF Transcript_159832/g.298013 Transcript_159832/m.298013 type:complete len:88 (+) Transcript_159832:334-597(+)
MVNTCVGVRCNIFLRNLLPCNIVEVKVFFYSSKVPTAGRGSAVAASTESSAQKSLTTWTEVSARRSLTRSHCPGAICYEPSRGRPRA